MSWEIYHQATYWRTYDCLKSWWFYQNLICLPTHGTILIRTPIIMCCITDISPYWPKWLRYSVSKFDYYESNAHDGFAYHPWESSCRNWFALHLKLCLKNCSLLLMCSIHDIGPCWYFLSKTSFQCIGSK